MQKLKIANRLLPEVISCKKRMTIRKGRREILLGDLLFETADQEGGEFPVKLVTVERVVHTTIGDMTDKEARQDGFKDVEDMLVGMKEYYSDLTHDSEVTLIYFWVEG